MRKPTAILILMFIMITANICPARADGTTVESFSPAGVVKKVRQVSVRFSGQMVGFGDPRIEDPFTITCGEKGSGRWADAANWVYDFDRDLPAGTVCTFKLKEGLKDISGNAVTGGREFGFSTGGPAVIYSIPYQGSSWIDEEQAFILTLDCEAVEASILDNVYFSVSGINERVGVRLLKGDGRTALIKANTHRWRPIEDNASTVILQARQRFPNGSQVTLVWGKGVSSTGGVKTEDDQRLPFKTRGPFIAKFSCGRENPEAGCIPFLPMYLSFESPVDVESAKKIRLVGGGQTYLPARMDEGTGGFVNGVSFDGPFPEKTAFKVEVPGGMKDDAGRPLENADKFPLDVRTDRYPPLAKFSGRFGIIEKADPVLPVTLRNVEPEVITRMVEAGGGSFSPADFGAVNGKARRFDTDKDVMDWLRKVDRSVRTKPLLVDQKGAWSFKLPKPNGANAFEVVGIPLKGAGLYVVELESMALGEALLGSKKPMYVQAAALVTDLSAHFLKGRESSLVWVTRLDTGEPVAGADVTVRDCEGALLWQGVTDKDGVAYIDKVLSSMLPSCSGNTQYEGPWIDQTYSRALSGMEGGMFVFARTADDMTFVHTSWDEGIETWRFSIPTWADRNNPKVATTVFDRTLFRAGETVNMKHIIRDHAMAGFRYLGKDRLPKAVSIVHTGTNQSYDFPLRWDTGEGIAETTWKIPPDARLGFYDVRLMMDMPGEVKEGERYYYSGYQSAGMFRVEEFRVPLMKGVIQPPAEPVVNKTEMDVDLQVTYLSGGGSAGLPVVLRTKPGPRYVWFDEYPEYTFANGKVKEGTVKLFGEEYEKAPDEPVTATDLRLGEGGTLRAKVTAIPVKDVPQSVLAEVEYRDPNGETKTVSRTIPVWNSDIVAGIMPDSWASSRDKFKFTVATLGISGKPAPGVHVVVDVFERKAYSHRRRMIGGFYAYEHVTETKKVGRLAEGVTDEKGLLVCESAAPATGELILQAGAKDSHGNDTYANRTVWVAGDDEWWFDVADNDRMDVLPEKKRYEPGDTASFQVRMPFREATALVTVEREGIIDRFVTNLSGKEPVIMLPVKGNYAPNVFVSVLCVRGRSGDAKPTALVDLGRPAYKLGIAQVSVGWKAHELKVKTSVERDVYKVREKARVRIKVVRADGGKLPPDAEVAVAAVDEGLLELKDNDSWALLTNMMGMRSCEVTASTAQMQVVGKRHYGLKALPAGGGGGSQRTRELFDTLLYWKARLPLDKDGEAEVTVPLGDALSSFRIAAVANAGAGYFGTGQTSIRTTQDLMLISGLPRMVRQGDRFRAVFTVRNASGREIETTISAKAGYENGELKLKPENVALAPGKAVDVGWDVDVPHGVEKITWQADAQSADKTASDSVRVTQKVIPAEPVRVFQATLMQLDGGAKMEVERPEDAEPGRGGIKVSMARSLTDELDGVRAYMKLYPYTCLEQKVSKSIALRDRKMWDAVMTGLPSYIDGDGLLKYFPTCIYGSEVLTAYVLSVADEAGWEVPGPPLSRILDGMDGFVTGRVHRRSSMPTADLSIRKMAAVEALSRYGKAEPRHLGSITIEPNLWPTSAVLDWLNVLVRVKGIQDAGKRTDEAKQVIRARLNFQGTTLGFSSEGIDYMWWLMVDADVNSVKAVIAMMDFDDWKQDMPRLMRGTVGRQKRARWSTTVANAWGVLALEKFARKFEAEPVAGMSTAKLGKDRGTLDWSKEKDGGSVMLGWPDGKKDVDIAHSGTGRPWVTVQSLAAIPLKKPFTSGYKVEKTLSPVVRREKGKWSAGDVVRVRLQCEAQADMTWVVVDDPIPAGATILGGGLGGDSRILTSGEKEEGWVWPAFEERSFEAFRAYYEFVPKGKWTVEYTARLNNPGVFLLPETRVEALYSPEMMGEYPNERFTVGR